MPTLAGVDYGRRRIGLAVGATDAGIASPLKVITGSDDCARDADAVADELHAFDVDEWVVGWPLNMDGTVGPQARLCERFAQALRERTGKPVHLFDERLSSREADSKMAGSDLTHKKKKRRRDALAALVMLQAFLDAQPPCDE